MIAGIFHEGSGLGNQLFRYVTSRVVAEDKGYDHAMIGTEKFKGASFMKNVHPIEQNAQPDFIFNEKKIIENGVDIRGYDPEINFIRDQTLLDGEFQDERYWGHRLNDVDKWLKVDKLNLPDDLCIIGFRGGEYSLFPDLYLTKEYWDKAISVKLAINPNMRFEVHTDDEERARTIFPHYKVVADIALNWRSVRYAKHLIIANSSFFIFPALLNEYTRAIAPRYWARRNTKVWALPQNYYPKFIYI